MALFGKKKGASPDVPPTNPASPATDSLSVETPNDAPGSNPTSSQSPFDDLLTAPPQTANSPGIQPESAFDFPDSSADTPAESTSNALDFDDVFGTNANQTAVATPDSFPNTPVATSNESFAVVPTPVPTHAAAPQPVAEVPEPGVIVHAAPKRKKFPVLPIVAAISALALAGGAYVLSQSSGEEEIDAEAPIVLPRREKPRVAEAPADPNPRPVPAANTSANAASSTKGIAPAPLKKMVSTKTTTNVSSTKALALTPAVAARLKTLWKAGADAKHRGDAARARKNSGGATLNYTQAREFWTQALQIKPGHPGFQESIDKLPK